MDPATIATAASAVFAGVSLFNSTVEQISRIIPTKRNVSIQITNNSDMFTLTNPRTYTSSGYCHHPPQPTIKKNQQEVCSFSKTANVACGSVGLLMYEIFNNQAEHVGELVIMFSVPFDYNLYKNKFALGIFEPKTRCDKVLYKQMYGVKDAGPLFARGKEDLIIQLGESIPRGVVLKENQNHPRSGNVPKTCRAGQFQEKDWELLR
ncbi:hypothetical protein SRHO_G00131000 [Serrasalmus rhombeus]